MEHDIAVMLPNENKMNKTIYTFKLRICFFFVCECVMWMRVSNTNCPNGMKKYFLRDIKHKTYHYNIDARFIIIIITIIITIWKKSMNLLNKKI